MDGDPTPALTGRRRTRPTSIGCPNPWQPEPGRAPLIAAHAAVQTNRATSHVMAVCQPSVPVLAAVALMEEEQDAFAPRSMTLMGGPIDTRVNPTAVNRLAMERGTEWFQRNAIMRVPLGHPGFGRDVYPGFLQLSGFMSLNMDRHVTAHWDLYKHLVQGDGNSTEKHREFYDEYLAVMDLTAEFYLQTLDTVFVRHALPEGRMTYRGRTIDLSSIRRVALMTVEGEKDDISGGARPRPRTGSAARSRA